jgi:HipA-like protein
VSTLPVCYENLIVGNIALGADGPIFAYDPRWSRTRNAFPMSLGMPLDSGLSRAFGAHDCRVVAQSPYLIGNFVSI